MNDQDNQNQGNQNQDNQFNQNYNQQYNQSQQPDQPPSYTPPGYSYPPHTTGPVPGKGAAIAALVLGICAIIMPIPYVNLAMGIVGIAMAVMAKKAGYNRGLATAGLVLSIIGTVFGAVIVLSFAACWTVLDRLYDPWMWGW